jgi:hypothetical protein
LDGQREIQTERRANRVRALQSLILE